MDINPYQPPQSNIQVTSGYNFLISVDDITILAGGSSFSGREYVYVDDELVSERRSQSRHSIHDFIHNGVRYRIEFLVDSFIKGHLTCQLYRNDELIRLYMATPEIKQPVLGVIYGVFVFAYLYTSEFIELPWWLFWVVTSGFVILTIIHAIQNMLITELAVDDTHTGNN